MAIKKSPRRYISNGSPAKVVWPSRSSWNGVEMSTMLTVPDFDIA
jgi:hypothetical protein